MDVMLRLPRGVDGFEGVVDESLRAADRPAHVESAVEIAEVLRRLESFLEGGTLLGYGGGTAWFGGPAQDAEAKRILGIPDDLTARQIVMIGRPKSAKDPRPTGPMRGRKPLSELVSYERWGA